MVEDLRGAVDGLTVFSQAIQEHVGILKEKAQEVVPQAIFILEGSSQGAAQEATACLAAIDSALDEPYRLIVAAIENLQNIRT